MYDKPVVGRRVSIGKTSVGPLQSFLSSPPGTIVHRAQKYQDLHSNKQQYQRETLPNCFAELNIPSLKGRVESNTYRPQTPLYLTKINHHQGCIFRLTCSHRELTEDHVLTSAYVKIFRTVTRNAVNKSV